MFGSFAMFKVNVENIINLKSIGLDSKQAGRILWLEFFPATAEQ
jgi:hypothetical protein